MFFHTNQTLYFLFLVLIDVECVLSLDYHSDDSFFFQKQEKQEKQDSKMKTVFS